MMVMFHAQAVHDRAQGKSGLKLRSSEIEGEVGTGDIGDHQVAMGRCRSASFIRL